MSIKCSSCGACCKMIGFNVVNTQVLVDIAVENSDERAEAFWRGIQSFPHDILADGSCSKLGIDGRCTIYNERPDVCRSEYVYHQLMADKMTEDEFTNVMAGSCNRLMDKLELPADFRV